MEIRKGDNVVVLTGKDKGKKGTVITAYPADNKVVVEGLNIAIKHMKPRGANQPGGKVNKPAAIDASNVMIVCPECGAATRIAHDKVDGKNVRKCKKCGAVLDVKATKKPAKKASVKKSVKKAAEAEVPAEETAATETAPKKKTAVKKATTKKAE